ncbi:hypothetical protein TanjilG_00153 [Lupinus angustifolius]|uniref:Uncharacterized protein n=1 Tax=Lupinus angustifolius TaxID=3871 RepID=A0A1J7GPI8_LUPAN|nr:hypothetical protein TanjilG_00153 [Lupinus angustifolius]
MTISMTFNKIHIKLTTTTPLAIKLNYGNHHICKSVKSSNIENSNAAKGKALNFGSESKTTLSIVKEREFISIDDDLEFTKPLLQHPKHNNKDQDLDDVALRKPTLVKPEGAMQGKCNLAESSRIDIDIEIPNISAAVMDDVTLPSNVNQVQPTINIRKESPLGLSNSGGICFSGGLLGPDGTNRFLGKWCKRGQNSESTSANGSGNGDLIAVGADGRGGRIKALRSSNQTFSREFISIDDDLEFTKPLLQHPKHNNKDQDLDDVALRKPTLVKPEGAMQGKCNLAESSRIDIDIEIPNISAAVMDDVTLPSNVNQVQPTINIRKESPLGLSNSGGICFSGGLLGPDGTNRFLGKWCKRGQNSESTSANGSGNGDLIAVGADGRGGRIKALRSSNQTFSDGKESSLCSKRLKLGSKTNTLQSKGCLQIEHFFGRVTQ